MKSLSILLCFIACFDASIALAQQDEFKTHAKPKVDTSARRKGLLASLLDDNVFDNINQVKQGVKDVKSDLKKNKEQAEKLGSFTTDIANDLGLKVKKNKTKAKGKKGKKDEYDGIKFERRIGEYGTGSRFTLEEINVLRNPDEAQPSVYAKEIWWYDPKLRRITNAVRKNPDYGEICHGPYRKYVNDALVEEGFFYVGVKDGRWESYNQEFILLNKEKYEKGFSAEARISYYDAQQKKIKEVVPVIFGKVTGEYRAFYEGGQLKEEGKFDDSVKVGRWRQYHQFGAMGRLKKETIYGKDKFEKAEPIVLQERDDKGKLIYEAPKQVKKKVDDDDDN